MSVAGLQDRGESKTCLPSSVGTEVSYTDKVCRFDPIGVMSVPELECVLEFVLKYRVRRRSLWRSTLYWSVFWGEGFFDVLVTNAPFQMMLRLFLASLCDALKAQKPWQWNCATCFWQASAMFKAQKFLSDKGMPARTGITRFTTVSFPAPMLQVSTDPKTSVTS